jgi:hypothetical protein
LLLMVDKFFCSFRSITPADSYECQSH